MPGSYWKIYIDKKNTVTWKSIDPQSTEPVNRTIDVVNPVKAEGEYPMLGDTFTLYNDRKPKITFDANGDENAKLANPTRGQEHVKTETLPFTNTQTSLDYTIKEGNPTWNTKFLNWNTEADGSGTSYKHEDIIHFSRQNDYDDMTLYAQWVPIVCKITDRENNLMYVNGNPAIYTTLKAAFDDYNDVNYNLSFTKEDGSEGTPRQIKMLVSEYTMTQPVALNRGKTVVLTTASPNDTDGYPAQSNVTVCTIKRGFEGTLDKNGDPFLDSNGDPLGSSMFTNRFRLTVRDIILDGASDNDAYKNIVTDGGIVRVDGDYSTLEVVVGAILRNSSVTGNGGAVYLANGITGLTLADGGTISGNKAANGAAVYVSPNATATVTGGTISDNTSAGSGAGICLPIGGKLDISGNPSFANNISTGASSQLPTGATNGREPYNAARQDIFLAEQGGENATELTNDPTAITVTGAITGDPGTIWVWAEDEYRYLQLMPFARLNGADAANNLAVFRNARDDELTENSSAGAIPYLRGTARGSKSGLVYWTGAYYPVSLRKVKEEASDSFSSLAGARFNVYRGDRVTPYVVRDKHSRIVKDTLSDSSLISLVNGVFWVGELPYGIYYLEELAPSANRWFVLTIDGNGVNLPDQWYPTREAAAAANPGA